MAQTYTLEEAAKRLGITPDVLKRRLKEDWKSLRAFRDGATLRFRTSDVDELARSLGEVSDPSLQLAPLDTDSHTSGDFQVPKSKKPPAHNDEPLIFDLSSSDDSISFEDPSPKKTKGDSDVRLEDAAPRSPRSDEIGTEEIDIDLAGPGSAIIREGSAARLSPQKSNTRLSATDSNKNIDKPNLGESSEFELSLEADSDDFELQINDDSSDDEVVLGDLTNKRPGGSGINLRDPKDSGVNLEGRAPKSGIKIGKKPKPPVDEPSDDDFELSLDPPAPSAKSGRSGKLPPVTSSDSEFELSLDDPSGDDSLMNAAVEGEEKNDIFETDFEIPALDEADESTSKAQVLDDSDSDSDTDQENSDFDLALDSSDIEAEDESASQVVVLDDDSEEVEAPSARRKSRAAAVEEDEVEEDEALDLDSSAEIEVEEEEEDVAGALQGVSRKSRHDDDEDDDYDDVDMERAPVAAAPTQWGVLPAIFLAPAFLILLLGSLIGYEMLHSMWGYHQPRPPGAPIVRGIAEMFEMDVKDQ